MRAPLVVMDYPVREELAQMLLAEWDDEIQTLPANGSHQTFTIGVRSGARTGVPSILSPNPRSASSNSAEKIESRSWIKNRYEWSLGTASRNCCRVHSAVGCGGTLQCRIRWLPISMISNTYRIWKRAVIAIRKSLATIA